MTIRICQRCHQHYIDNACPHCASTSKLNSKQVMMALILGLGLTACGEKTEDTATSEPAEEPAAEPDMSDLYGVAQ